MSFNPLSTNIAPESAYNTASNQLADRLERMENLLSQLRHRLIPVLLAPIDDTKDDEARVIAPAPMPAPLVATLEHHAIRADNLGNEVSDLLRRLCL